MAACAPKAKKDSEPEQKAQEVKKKQENYDDGMDPKVRASKLRDIFKANDEDGDLLLDLKEWLACSAKRDNVDPEKATDAQKEKWTEEFKEVDKSNSGTISLAELDLWIATKQLEAVNAKFKDADDDGSRSLDKTEFHDFFKAEGMKKKARKKLWDKCNTNKDEKVTFVEFRDFMTREMADGVLAKTFGDMFKDDEAEERAEKKKKKGKK